MRSAISNRVTQPARSSSRSDSARRPPSGETLAFAWKTPPGMGSPLAAKSRTGLLSSHGDRRRTAESGSSCIGRITVPSSKATGLGRRHRARGCLEKRSKDARVASSTKRRACNLRSRRPASGPTYGPCSSQRRRRTLLSFSMRNMIDLYGRPPTRRSRGVSPTRSEQASVSPCERSSTFLPCSPARPAPTERAKIGGPCG